MQPTRPWAAEEAPGGAARGVCASLGCLLHTACGNQATLRTRKGATHTGEILRTDGRHVVLDDDQGRVLAIDRSEVTEVKHPGGGAIVTGVVLIAAGVLLGYGVTRADCNDDDHTDESCASLGWYMLAIPALPGVGLGIYGWVVRETSVDRYENVRGPPVVRPGASGRAPGLAIETCF